MWVRVEATATCGTCAGTTPVNAAVDAIGCDDCGAEIAIRVWGSAVDEMADTAEELVANDRRNLEWELGSGSLKATLARVTPACPHCEAEWTEPVAACPDCGIEIEERARGSARLVGEDRALLAGQKGEVQPETLHCPSCAAPMRVDGTTRSPTCEACGGQLVVPDEVWRRVHAPTRVAPWYLWVAGGGSAAALPEYFSLDEMAAVGSRLVGIGGVEDGAALFVVDTDPVGIVWKKGLGEAAFGARVAVTGDAILVFSEMSKTVKRYAVSDGSEQGSVKLPEDVQDLAVDPDGTWVVHTHPLGALRRFDATGELQWLWGEPGFFGKLFGGGKPKLDHVTAQVRPSAGMKASAAGRLSTGPDGDLRLVSGRYVARFARDGSMKWCVDACEAFQDGGVSIVAPAAAPDGTTWAVMVGALKGDETREARAVLVRIAADGSGSRPVQLGQLYPSALAVTADGHVWLGHGHGLRRLDPDGNLLWRHER